MNKLLLVSTATLLLNGLTVAPEAEARDRCRNCGTVEHVERYVERGQRSHGGAVVGAILGAAVGNQVGSGSGRRAATVAGAVAGAAIGNNSDRRRAERVVWEIRVRMDNGRVQEYSQYDNPDRLRRGDRVLVRNGYVQLY
jgi:outer membrane lipoprotein SlyB